jgi:anti-sigma B factor antagonist
MNTDIVIDIPKSFVVEDAAKFRIQINKLIENGGKNFMLDFSKCEFIDSTGLGVIVAAYKKCIECGGNIKLKSLNDDVRKLFKLTRLDKVLEIYS